MSRICQNMKLSDVINPPINSSGAGDIEVNTVGENNELISVNKELHEFLLAYKIAMQGVMEGDNNPCTSHFFRNTKGKCFSYGIGKAITRFRDKYMLGLHKNEITSDDTKVSETPLNQKKAQTRLVDNFVCNVLSDMYLFMNEPPTVKQIENSVKIKMNKPDTLDESAEDYTICGECWSLIGAFPKKLKTAGTTAIRKPSLRKHWKCIRTGQAIKT